jgi:hypothetical protein
MHIVHNFSRALGQRDTPQSVSECGKRLLLHCQSRKPQPEGNRGKNNYLQ